MTKFGKSEKTGLSSFLFRNIWFWQFQGKAKEGAKIEDLKIQGVLRHKKRLRSVKEIRWKKFKLKVEAVKNGLSGLGYRSIRFFRTDSLIRI
jgi:hypothetical protein